MTARLKPRGVTIDAFRRSNHLSTTELARRAGLSRQYVSRILRGERGASPAAIERLAAALDVRVEAIADEAVPR